MPSFLELHFSFGRQVFSLYKQLGAVPVSRPCSHPDTQVGGRGILPMAAAWTRQAALQECGPNRRPPLPDHLEVSDWQADSTRLGVGSVARPQHQHGFHKHHDFLSTQDTVGKKQNCKAAKHWTSLFQIILPCLKSFSKEVNTVQIILPCLKSFWKRKKSSVLSTNLQVQWHTQSDPSVKLETPHFPFALKILTQVCERRVFCCYSYFLEAHFPPVFLATGVKALAVPIWRKTFFSWVFPLHQYSWPRKACISRAAFLADAQDAV